MNRRKPATDEAHWLTLFKALSDKDKAAVSRDMILCGSAYIEKRPDGTVRRVDPREVRAERLTN